MAAKFEQTPLTEKVSGVSVLSDKAVDPKLVTRYKTLVHKQDIKIWAAKSLTLAYLDDYINKFAKGEEFSYARFKGGEKADVEVLRTLLFLKDNAANDIHKHEAEQLINELGIINKAAEQTLDPNKSITFFTVGAFYEVYGDEAVFMADKFDLTLTKNKSTGRELVGVPHYTFDNYRAVLESIDIKTTVLDESDIVNVVDKSLDNSGIDFALDTNNFEYLYSKSQKFQDNVNVINSLPDLLDEKKLLLQQTKNSLQMQKLK